MARFYFDMVFRDRVEKDEDGCELLDIDHACAAAWRTLLDRVRGMRELETTQEATLMVRDEQDKMIAAVLVRGHRCS